MLSVFYGLKNEREKSNSQSYAPAITLQNIVKNNTNILRYMLLALLHTAIMTQMYNGL